MATSSFLDQMGNTITLHVPPQRIISLVPSQTELLADLGLTDRIVGITKFCVHPSSWSKSKTIIGGTKKFNFDVIQKLSPDLIIGNKEENYKEGIETLRDICPVWMSDIFTLADALSMISSLGKLTGKEKESAQIASDVAAKFGGIKKFNGQSVLYLIWREPWIAAASDTFINCLLNAIELRNSVAHKQRYPQLQVEEIKKLEPEYILLSSEPFPFNERNIKEIQDISPKSKILLVDGEMFSWYGSRLLKAADYFNALQLP